MSLALTPPRVAIVGAGFCGAVLAHHLARAGRPLEIVLIDRRGVFGPGLAYRTDNPRHLLNTPAGRMSALADDPDHFTRWARARDPAVHGGSFLPRGLYGAYLRDLLAVTAARPGARLTCLEGHVLSISPDPPALHLAAGPPVAADAVVLAQGNLAPALPAGLPAALRADPRYCHDPWSAPPAVVPPGATVMVLGTGLTALDLAVGLRDAGHHGPIHLLSRHGLLSRSHRASARAPSAVPLAIDAWPPTARGALHELRAAVRLAGEQGVDWREVITALRPVTAALWRRWPPGERERFVAHLRPFWDVHRHRAAPETAAEVAAMQASGQLRVHAGHVQDLSVRPDGLVVTFRPRGSREPVRLAVDRVLNATGPASDPRRAHDPLLADLERRGLLVPDPLGAHVDDDGAILDRAGKPSRWLFALGALRRPQLWETTAVLELAPQVDALARTLLARLAR